MGSKQTVHPFSQQHDPRVVGQVDAVGFVQVVEVLVTVHFLVREGQGVSLVGQTERQRVGVVVDVADQGFTGVLGFVVV